MTVSSYGELIGTWEVSHFSSYLRLFEVSSEDVSGVPNVLLYLIGDPPQNLPEVWQFTFYKDNIVREEVDGMSGNMTYEYDEEAKELTWSGWYAGGEGPIHVSFSYTGNRMSWTTPNMPGYMVLESVS